MSLAYLTLTGSKDDLSQAINAAEAIHAETRLLQHLLEVLTRQRPSDPYAQTMAKAARDVAGRIAFLAANLQGRD